MRVGPDEPVAGPWRVERLDAFAESVVAAAGDIAGRPRIVAVDGRSGGGKTYLAGRLAGALPGSAVVHTDDVAWWHSRFGWADLMADGILAPLRAGKDVHYQPPGWRPHGRDGWLDVPAASPTVLVEGVGAARRELGPLIDVAVWVQSDYALTRRRGLERDLADKGIDMPAAVEEWDAWEVEELPFHSADRPWERAAFIVAGTPVLDHDPETQIVVAQP
jgi:hypothetical protein